MNIACCDRMIHKIKHLAQQINGQLFIETGDYRHTVFLAGTGKSGTTWVQNIINYDNSFRMMFEPFHSLKISHLKQWNHRQYLREDNTDEMFLKTAKRILSGNIQHRWIDHCNRKHWVRKRLIKDIRANLFLKWIRCNFPEIPIILLLRHPCAVVNSKLKLGWDTHLNDLLKQPDLMNDIPDSMKEAMTNAEDPFDKHLVMWCVENYIPLKQFKNGEILIVFYENICENPQKQANRVMSFIKEDQLPLEAFDRFSQPSSHCRKDSAIITGGNLLDAWKNNIPPEKIKRAVEILSIFGLDHIYGEEIRPRLSEEEALQVISAE